MHIEAIKRATHVLQDIIIVVSGYLVPTARWLHS